MSGQRRREKCPCPSTAAAIPPRREYRITLSPSLHLTPSSSPVRARASKVTGGQLKLRDSDVTLNGPWTLGMIHNDYPAKNGGSYLQLHSIHILPISSPKYPILHSSEALKQ